MAGKTKIVITTLPVTTNRLYRNAPGSQQRLLSKKAKSMKEAVAWEAKAGWMHPPKDGPVKVEIVVYWPDERKRDVDNVKGFIDALNGVLWEDDSQITDLTLRKRVDREEPRVEIFL